MHIELIDIIAYGNMKIVKDLVEFEPLQYKPSVVEEKCVETWVPSFVHHFPLKLLLLLFFVPKLFN